MHLQDHPSELAYVCKRKTALKEIDPHSIESTVIFKLPDRADVKIVPYNVNDDIRLKNSENVQKIG